MAKYIENKKIKPSKTNEINDFKGIDKATWKLISAIYNSKWDSLFANGHKNTFKQKFSLQFTLKTPPAKNGKNGEKDTNKLASIQQIPPPIPTKSPKEVNEISKYFKTTKPP